MSIAHFVACNGLFACLDNRSYRNKLRQSPLRAHFASAKCGFILVLVLVFFGASVCHACPACFVSAGKEAFWQRFWAMAFMGTVPLVIAGAVIFKINRMIKNEHK